MKKIVIIFSLLILITGKDKAQDYMGTNKQERKVLALINSLPEVVNENKFRKSAGSTTFLRAYIQKTPTKTDNYYYISTSEEKGGRLFTYDWYKVSSSTCGIRYYDVINDKTTSLNEWRMHKK